MTTILFDGKTFASEKERELQKQVDELHFKGKTLHVKTFTFQEDVGSRLYTSLKQKAAARIGISYEPVECSISDDLGMLIQDIREQSFDRSVTGVMVQKPTKEVWEKYNDKRATAQFETWWENLTTAIDPVKDVDCLTRSNLDRIFATRVYDRSLILPATVKACLSILQHAKNQLNATNEAWAGKSVLVIGRSEIVGKPLTHVLRLLGHTVVNVGRKEFETTQTQDFPILISATGQKHVLTGNMMQEGAVVIDVGSPDPDVERFSSENKASFLTPVPGGVGPVTVVSLMENILQVVS